MTNDLRERLERVAATSRPVGAETLMERVARQLSGEPTTGLVTRRALRPWFAYAAALVAVLVVGSVTWLGLTRSEEPPAASGGDPVDRWVLAAAELPETEAAVVAVFEAMPAELGGRLLTSNPTGGHLVEYGEGGPSLAYQTSEHRVGVDGSVMRPAEAIEQMSSAEELDVIGFVADESVVWLHATFAAGDGSPDTGRILVVGDADGEFLFLFGAPTNEGLDAIVAAFIDVSGRVATGEVATTTTTTTLVEETTLPEDPPVEIPARVDDTAWIGIRFTAAVNTGWTGSEFGRLDEWVEDPYKIVDVGAFVVRLVVDGEATDAWPWQVGSTGGPVEILVVGDEPSPYTPGEYAQEIEGVEPAGPDPDARHELAVWAVDGIGGGVYEVTDVVPLVRSGENMGYGALVEIRREFDLCVVDSSVIDNIYGYFDHADPELEVSYPATLVFRMVDGRVETVDPTLVSCILNADWETRGY